MQYHAFSPSQYTSIRRPTAPGPETWLGFWAGLCNLGAASVACTAGGVLFIGASVSILGGCLSAEACFADSERSPVAGVCVCVAVPCRLVWTLECCKSRTLVFQLIRWCHRQLADVTVPLNTSIL